jgi:small-conductance mechanosensitive channel
MTKRRIVMPYNWGPHYIVPSEAMKNYSGAIQLREEFDEDALRKELEEMNLKGPVVRVSNPWYYRKKNTETWIMIGESSDKQQNFPVRWDTTGLKNGQYEILGLMHIFVRKNGSETAIARQNIVEVTVKN